MAAFIIFGIIVFLIIWANTGTKKPSSNNRRRYSSTERSFQTHSIESEEDKALRQLREIQRQEENRQKELLLKQEIEDRKKKEIARNIETFKGKVQINPKKYKSDWQVYHNVIETNDIKALYHFTDKANLQSIKDYGALYSWYYCLVNNIEVPVPGGGELSHQLDKKKGLHNYVHISFTRNHPMMFVPPSRANNCVILSIDPEAIFWVNTKFANKNATRNDVNIGSTIDDFKKIKFDIVKLRNHFDLDEITKPYYQGEILVLEKIPLEFIRNLEALLAKPKPLSDLPF